MLAYTVTPATVSVVIDGTIYNINNTHANFRAIRNKLAEYSNAPNAARDAIQDTLSSLVNIPKFVAKFTEGRVQVGETGVRYDGQTVEGAVSERLIGMVAEGFSPEPLARFLEKLQQNPLESARKELYLWLETSRLPICEDGDFLAYKRVNDDYTSIHDGRTDNSIGARPTEDRDACDTDRTRTCSRGLHFCSLEYLAQFSGDRTVIVKVDPANVVAIPMDYNNQKGRAWTYEVVSEIENTQEAAEGYLKGVPVAKVEPTGIGMSDKHMFAAPEGEVAFADDADLDEYDDDEYGADTEDTGAAGDGDEDIQIFGDDADAETCGARFVDGAFDYDHVLEYTRTTVFGKKRKASIKLGELHRHLIEFGQRGAARRLRVPRTTIQGWIKKYGLA